MWPKLPVYVIEFNHPLVWLNASMKRARKHQRDAMPNTAAFNLQAPALRFSKSLLANVRLSNHRYNQLSRNHLIPTTWVPLPPFSWC